MIVLEFPTLYQSRIKNYEGEYIYKTLNGRG